MKIDQNIPDYSLLGDFIHKIDDAIATKGDALASVYDRFPQEEISQLKALMEGLSSQHMVLCEYARTLAEIQEQPQEDGVQAFFDDVDVDAEYTGSDDRCQFTCCKAFGGYNKAAFYHPDTFIPICRDAARFLMNEAIARDDDEEIDRLSSWFKIKRLVVLRAEHLFYHELVKRVPEN